MKRNLIEPKPPWERDRSDRWFNAWFIFCAICAVMMLIGGVALVIYLLPHIVDLIDRIGQ